MTQDELEAIVEYLISVQLGCALRDIDPADDLKKDLGADSLDIAELVMSLEMEFQVEIPVEATEGLLTVQDVINFVQKRVA